MRKRCKLCPGIVFNCTGEKERHLVETHNRTFDCDVCGTPYANRRSLRRYELISFFCDFLKK